MKAKLVQDRWEVIEKFVVGKDVLDAGCAELLGTISAETKMDWWIHKKLKKVAKQVVGVDINQREVEALGAKGYNIILGDVEQVDIGRDFDVIVAGELIEHLSNPGMFLDNMKRHLREDGVLILTTPNRFDFYTFMVALVTGKLPSYDKPIASHVHYYDVYSLKDLANRHGYEVVDLYYYYEAFPTLKSKVVLQPIIKARPSFAKGIVMVLKREKA